MFLPVVYLSCYITGGSLGLGCAKKRFKPEWMWKFFLRPLGCFFKWCSEIGFVQYIQERSTLAKIAASATGDSEHRHTQQLCCGDGDPKKRLRPSMWLVENPNSDVGWDLRPKLGMYSRRAMRLTLVMYFLHGHCNMDWAFICAAEAVNRSESLLTFCSISLLERFCILS